MRRSAIGAGAALGALLLVLTGCAAAPEPDALDLCEEQMAGDLETAGDGTAADWEGGQVEDRPRVFEYTATLTLGGVDVEVSCQVASTPDGLFLQGYEVDPAD